MTLTTNSKLERKGANAIPLAQTNGKLQPYIVGCKTYFAEEYPFNKAVYASTKYIVNHFKDHRDELNLYSFDNFVTPELESICQEYLEGERGDIEVNLVCMVAYDNSTEITVSNQQDKLKSSIDSIDSIPSTQIVKGLSLFIETIYNNCPHRGWHRYDYNTF
ncbi:MAG: SAVED domain-containing protein [SAR324 cluster bacterium]|nr:SAVED domain-containing protein [SAR324 cluster bacterium]